MKSVCNKIPDTPIKYNRKIIIIIIRTKSNYKSIKFSGKKSFFPSIGGCDQVCFGAAFAHIFKFM